MFAAVLDFFDGFFAKILNVHSALGKQLDSLADLVSFGLAPAIIIYVFLGELQTSNIPSEFKYLKLSVLLIPLFSAIRLAKFNIDDKQQSEFIGLPTPANALFFVSAIASLSNMGSLYKVAALDFYMLVILVIIFSFLLVIPIKFLSLKFNTYKWIENKNKYVFIMVSALIILICVLMGNPVVCLSFIILLYLFISLLRNILKKNEI